MLFDSRNEVRVPVDDVAGNICVDDLTGNICVNDVAMAIYVTMTWRA
jgi:hypothetical protein